MVDNPSHGRRQGKVLLLNGTSSAGKTSIAQALQRQLDENYVLLSIDQYLSALPPGLHNSVEGVCFIDETEGVRLHLGPAGISVERAFHRAVRAVVDEGLNVLVDDVFFEPWLLDDWRSVLAGVELTLVGIHCPLAEVERREAERGDRRIGQARSQYKVVHSACSYDIEMDTMTLDPDLAAAMIKTQLMRTGV